MGANARERPISKIDHSYKIHMLNYRLCDFCAMLLLFAFRGVSFFVLFYKHGSVLTVVLLFNSKHCGRDSKWCTTYVTRSEHFWCCPKKSGVNYKMRYLSVNGQRPNVYVGWSWASIFDSIDDDDDDDGTVVVSNEITSNSWKLLVVLCQMPLLW